MVCSRPRQAPSLPTRVSPAPREPCLPRVACRAAGGIRSILPHHLGSTKALVGLQASLRILHVMPGHKHLISDCAAFGHQVLAPTLFFVRGSVCGFSSWWGW